MSCRTPSVDLGDKCLSELNLSYFRGIYPDITVDELYKIAGKPDDKFEVTGDDPSVDLVYYNEQGRLLLHWSGDEDYEIGMIEFMPKIRLTKKDILRHTFSINKQVVSLSCHE